MTLYIQSLFWLRVITRGATYMIQTRRAKFLTILVHIYKHFKYVLFSRLQ